MHGICTVTVAFLYIILIFFLSSHILSLSLSLSLSLQPIISTTDNSHCQPHKPNTTTHITVTQHSQTPPPQPSIANHHHQNTDTSQNQTNPHIVTPQNQPKIKHRHTNIDRESIFGNLQLWVNWNGACGSVLVVLWLWIIACWSLIGDRGSWIGDWKGDFNQEGARERWFHHCHHCHYHMWINVGSVDQC